MRSHRLWWVGLAVSMFGVASPALGDDCNGNGIDDSAELSVCPSSDLVIIIDTSGSITGHLDELCSVLEIVDEMLTQQMDIDIEILSINNAPGCACCDGSVAGTYGAISGCDPEEMPEHWGRAVEWVLEEKSWTTGQQIIVPISDEGPACGDPLDTDDNDIIDDAIAAALATGHRGVIIPIVTGGSQSLAEQLAYSAYPGGRVFDLNGADLAAQLIAQIEGLCPADCNTDQVLDECEISLGAADTDHNRIPDGCELNTPAAATGVHAARKNRFISFVPSNGSRLVNYRVRETGSEVERWVVAPAAGVDATNNVSRVCGDGTSETMPDPQIWTEPVIHVTGCLISPVHTYEIEATYDSVVFSPALSVGTILKPGSKYWADTNGSFTAGAWTGPDGLVNFTDVSAVVQAFQNLPTKPHVTWVDLVSVAFPGDPNLGVNFADINGVINGFQGLTYPGLSPGNCPGDDCTESLMGSGFGEESMAGGGMESMSGGVSFEVAVSPYQIEADETVEVEVALGSAVSSLGTWQVTLEVTGGDSGSLELESIESDTQRSDFAFYGQSITNVASLAQGAIGATMNNAQGVSVDAGDYLATFTFRASAYAGGVFTVQAKLSDSFLVDGDDAEILAANDGFAYIRVGVECTSGDHCIDGIQCTDDLCNSGTCANPNSTSGTPCDDGLFCTATDTCDGNGTCTGTGSPCPPAKPKCCEIEDVCIRQSQSCAAQEE